MERPPLRPGEWEERGEEEDDEGEERDENEEKVEEIDCKKWRIGNRQGKRMRQKERVCVCWCASARLLNLPL